MRAVIHLPDREHRGFFDFEFAGDLVVAGSGSASEDGSLLMKGLHSGRASRRDPVPRSSGTRNSAARFEGRVSNRTNSHLDGETVVANAAFLTRQGDVFDSNRSIFRGGFVHAGEYSVTWVDVTEAAKPGGSIGKLTDLFSRLGRFLGTRNPTRTISRTWS